LEVAPFARHPLAVAIELAVGFHKREIAHISRLVH
jgi:hypothetical protein